MFIAIDENEEYIDIDEAVKGNKYYCPECDNKLIIKDGDIKIKHFAHESNIDCDSWAEMSVWHKEWQSKFDKSVREVVLTKDGKKHRADIHISVKGINLTIEFQKSPISKININKRNNFYSKFGHVLWVFDLREKDIRFDKSYKNLYKFKWNYSSKYIPLPKELAKQGIDICFQMENDKVVFPCGVDKDDWKEFYCRKSDYIEVSKLIDVVKNNYFLNPYSRSKFILDFLTPYQYYQSKNNSSVKPKREYKLVPLSRDELTANQLEAIDFGYNKIEDFCRRVYI